MLFSNPIQSVQENYTNEDQSENVILHTEYRECDYRSNGEPRHESHLKSHSTGEAVNLIY